MRNIVRLVLLIILVSVAGNAEDLPDAPAKISDSTASSASHTVAFKKEIYGPLVAACGTAAVFDGQMSHSYIMSHPNTREASSWLLGERPSLGRYYATFAVMDGTAAIVSYKLLHSRRKAIRAVGWGIIAGLTAIHTYDDIRIAAK